MSKGAREQGAEVRSIVVVPIDQVEESILTVIGQGLREAFG